MVEQTMCSKNGMNFNNYVEYKNLKINLTQIHKNIQEI
jgi:hypothetical protein